MSSAYFGVKLCKYNIAKALLFFFLTDTRLNWLLEFWISRPWLTSEWGFFSFLSSAWKAVVLKPAGEYCVKNKCFLSQDWFLIRGTFCVSVKPYRWSILVGSRCVWISIIRFCLPVAYPGLNGTRWWITLWARGRLLTSPWCTTSRSVCRGRSFEKHSRVSTSRLLVPPLYLILMATRVMQQIKTTMNVMVAVQVYVKFICSTDRNGNSLSLSLSFLCCSSSCWTCTTVMAHRWQRISSIFSWKESGTLPCRPTRSRSGSSPPVTATTGAKPTPTSLKVREVCNSG